MIIFRNADPLECFSAGAELQLGRGHGGFMLGRQLCHESVESVFNFHRRIGYGLIIL
jgi:hypothetical protein